MSFQNNTLQLEVLSYPIFKQERPVREDFLGVQNLRNAVVLTSSSLYICQGHVKTTPQHNTVPISTNINFHRNLE
jgi:hypothetical protein